MRKIDSLGRIVLPKELRKKLGIDSLDSLEIYVEGELIILKKENKADCVFCGGNQNLTRRLDKNVCDKCFGILISDKHSGVDDTII